MTERDCFILTKVFDQCLYKKCSTFGPLIVPGLVFGEWKAVDCQIGAIAGSGTISPLGGPNIRLVTFTVSGQARVIIQNVTTGAQLLELVPFTFSGRTLMWAPKPALMSVVVEATARCEDVDILDEATPGGPAIGITVDVSTCDIVKTTANVQFLMEEPPLCRLPDECEEAPRSCPEPVDCDADDFVIPQRKEDMTLL